MSGFDVIVVGAGIHGAGVAQAAAAAGHRVLVLEQQHPAYGTSSRSSKLIHGGLRYLETGQFRLVRESLFTLCWVDSELAVASAQSVAENGHSWMVSTPMACTRCFVITMRKPTMRC